MTHDDVRLLLDDYATGELAGDARAPVAEHVAACVSCAAEVESVRKIIARAAELPRSIEAPTGSWSVIRSAIERDKVAGAEGGSGPARGFRRRPYALAAAAVLVAIISSAGTAFYMISRGASSGPALFSARDTGGGAAPAALAAFTIEENSYLRRVAVLQDVLDRQESSLAPATVAQLKASLRTIDEAILEARNALARDPANKLLVEMLTGTYRQKVDLLRRTTEMTRGS